MTGHLTLTTSLAERRRHIAGLHEMIANFTSNAERFAGDEKLAQAELWWRRASTISWALEQVA